MICVEHICREIPNNQLIYNFLGIFELLILSFVFYDSVTEALSKKIIKFIFFCCIILLLVDLMFITGSISIFLSYFHGFASLGIAFICFVYLLEIVRSDKIMQQFRMFLFWVSFGLLTFHLCNLPITVLINRIEDFGDVDTLMTIQNVASIVKYGCFITGFIISKWSNNI